MSFANVYDDTMRADAYATLEFPGTYWLAFRDLPAIIAKYVAGRTALDFGCGAGRSTRFLKQLGFGATGIDVSSSMIERARGADPQGDYRLIDDSDFSALEPARFDLILCAFPFDNIPGTARRRDLLRGMRGLLNDDGRIVLVGSAAEIYTHEWTSFTTKDFPENAGAKSGDTVRIVMTDVDDWRPVVDAIWFHDDYLKLFAEAELDLVAYHSPLGRKDEPFEWVTETSISPWFIYVLKKKGLDMTAKLTGAERTVARFLRVNHAGEHAAIHIYSAQIAVARRTRPDIVPFLEETLAHERKHLARFRGLMPVRGTGPSVLMPVWGVGGSLLGFMTAAMGRNGIAICTEAIERTVHRHLNHQLEWLGGRDPEFAAAIREVRDEEMGHLDDAVAIRTCKGPAARLLDGFVAWVTRSLIWLSTCGAERRG